MSQVGLSPNPAAVPPARAADNAGPTFPLAAGGGAMFMVAVPLFIVALLTPHYVELYRDFGVRLPGFTRAFVDLGKFIGSPLGATTAIVLALVVGAMTFAIARASRAAAVTVLVLCLLWLLGVGGGFILSNAVVIPAMIESLQSGNAD